MKEEGWCVDQTGRAPDGHGLHALAERQVTLLQDLTAWQHGSMPRGVAKEKLCRFWCFCNNKMNGSKH